MFIHCYRKALLGFPKNVAIVSEAGSFSFKELENLSNRVASTLISLGIKKGDRVVIYMDNCLEAVVSIFGILKAGGIFVPVNSNVKAQKLSYILEDSCPTILVTSSARLNVIHKSIAGNNKVKSILVDSFEIPPFSTKEPIKLINLQNVFSSKEHSLPDQKLSPNDLAAIIYTSGTTGHPKGVMLSHNNIISAVKSIIAYLNLVENDKILNVHPISFDYGLYQILMGFSVGCTVIIRKSYGYSYFIIKLLQDEKVSVFPIVPTIASLLAELNGSDDLKCTHLRLITNTADRLTAGHITALQTLFPAAKIFSMYGQTECKRVSYLPPEELKTKPNSVGIAMPRVKTYIIDEERRCLCPPNTEGELIVSGPNVMVGYWNDPKATAEKIKSFHGLPGKFLFTNDIFTMDEDGYLYFVRRKDDTLKVRGIKVSPKEMKLFLRVFLV